MYKKWKIPRRTFLKGLGASVAIPYLEIMFSSDKAMAQAINDKNFVMMYFDNGAGNARVSPHTPNNWYLAGQGAIQGNMPLVYSSLNPHKANVHLMTNVGLVPWERVNIEIRGDGNEHTTGLHLFATGGSSKSKTEPNQGNQSIDDVILQAKIRRGFGGTQSININERNLSRNNAGGINIQYGNNISFKANGQANVLREDPQSVFNAFFSGNNSNPLASEASQRGLKIVDFIKRDRDRLMRKVSNKDKMVLDQYYSSLSEIEDKVKGLAEGGRAVCQDNGQVSAALQNGKREAFTTLITMAFQCGIAKTSTYMLMGEVAAGATVNSIINESDRAFDGNSIPIANSDIHNTIGHGIDTSPNYAHNIASYNHFQVRALATLIEKMKAAPVAGGGSVFDSTMIYAGWNMTANHYVNRDAPVFLAGGANSGVIGGRCTTEVVYSREILATIKKSFGIPSNEWGSAVPTNTKDHIGKIAG